MGPCDWPIDYCEASVNPDWDALTPDRQAVYEQVAVEWLWRWTGRVFGLCPAQLRPCTQEPTSWRPLSPGNLLPGPWAPALLNGQWYNLSACGVCTKGCACESASVLQLPFLVNEVVAITIDGVAVPPTEYTVDSRNRLIRLDGAAWPSYQDEHASDFVIDVLLGRPVPVGGQVAAGVLAVEIWMAACGNANCGLPKRVQTITRQGVSVAMLDSFDDVDRGHTGIWLVDSWVASQSYPQRRSIVRSPDVPNRGYRWPTTP